ncbi:ricin-type beta-trefoil lectin domain protein [Dactylosporangium sp. CA-092794]|uniref:ricin-type beta-trefoil lectin domain protein n=1 Tax=Dactylosporangium sp. CA-092794 TaxID=3239929 RepID=UPI003D950787
MLRYRLPLIAVVTVALSLTATAAFAITRSGTAALAAGPSASQLLARTQTCTQVSNGKYATDDGGAATVAICKSGSAYFWTADMDIDCDGIGTSHCNAGTDPWYQPQTSFTTSTGAYFTSDVTRYYVVPLPSSRFDYGANGIRAGSVAAVVYNNQVAYAVFADEGPNNIIGEGSYALAVALGIDPNPATGGTAGPVTFIVFPGSVPSPVENNAAIDTTGANAANTWLGTGPTSGPTTGGPTGPGGSTGQIVGYGSKCVDVAGASSANGAAVQLYDCNGTAAQQWTRATDGTLRALGKCMDVTGAGTANGTKVQLYDCNGTNAQKWTRTGQTLVNVGSGKCLDATGPSSANGTRLQIWTCGGGTNQNWTVPA